MGTYGLFSANVSSRTSVHDDVKVVSRSASVLANQTSLVGLVDGDLHVGRLVVEFTTNVDVGSTSAHGTASDQAAFDELVRVVTHDLSVLAGAWLAFVCVDDQVLWSAVRGLIHEAPLESGWKAGAAAASQARGLDLVDDPVGSFQQDLLGLVPVSLKAVQTCK